MMHALRALLVGQLLLRSCVAGFAASLLWPSSRLERRAEKMARLLGPSPLDEKDDKVEDGCPHALVEVCSARGIRKPAGSRVLISETDAGTLIVEVPGRRWRASDAGQASFVAVWLSIVGAWTAGAMAASPFFALFSTPFWLAGVRMAKDLVPSSTIVSIGKYAWEIATNTPLKSSPKVVSGATVDLDEAKLAIDAYVNDSPVTSLRLVEGVNEHVVRGLAPVEQQFLADLINAWLDHLGKRRPSRGREPIPEASRINIEASRIGD